MKSLGSWLLILLCAAGCKRRDIPDVSNIKVDLQVQRFEKDFFAIDTTKSDESLQQLHQKYPTFTQDFLFNILALPPQPDSVKTLQAQLSSFLRSYQPLKDSADKVFSNLDDVADQVKRGLQFVKHYFPSYRVPTTIVSFIGPINSYANILTQDAFAVGLQSYMGKNYSLYNSEAGQSLYPAYVSRRFDKLYIPVNCMKNIIDDIFPDNSAGKPLIEQMVQEGKRMYILDHLLPETADSLKTGYTQAQLDGAIAHETNIWSYFVQNDLLYSTEQDVMRDYMNDSPKTLVFGEGSPGFIGKFVGWQIVKKWMSKNEKLTLTELINTGPQRIFSEAKYKP